MKTNNWFFLTFILSFLFTSCWTQTNNVWTFGVNARLDFVNGVNPPNVSSSAISSYEGSASISDVFGNLLFYTDGITVYNNANNIIQTGLLGHWSSAQCGIIVPEPGTTVNSFSNRYYIFSIPELASERARYTIVDVNAGIPVVNPGNVNLTLPDHLTALNTTESISVARHCNGIDFWIITHEIGNNKFKAYQLTNTGIMAPVISTIGPISSSISGNINAACHMKISPDNRKLAFCVRKMSVTLFDFNPSNGIITNPVTVASGSSQNYYGVEFSSNSAILYYTDLLTNLFKYEIASGTNLAIGTINGPNVNNIYGALQLAPNGVIYMGRDAATNMSSLNQPFLGVIANPNNFLGATFTANGLTLASGTASKVGLPNMIPTINSSLYSISNDTTICVNESVTLSCSGGVSYTWAPTTGLNSTNTATVVASPLATQTYVVSITDAQGCIGSKSVNIIVDTTCCNQVFNTTETVSLCQNENFIFPDGTSQVIVSAISYTSNLITQNGCDSIVTTNVSVFPVLEIHDTIAECYNETITFPDGTNQLITGNLTHISTLISSVGCDSTIYTHVLVFPNYNNIFNETICAGTSYTFADGTTHVNILNDEIYTLNNTSIFGCDSITTIHLIIINPPFGSINGAQSICEDETIELSSSDINPNYNYFWNNGQQGPFISILNPGIYILSVENTCGISSDSIAISAENCNCNLYIPNCFTPDDNENNQTFKVAYDCDIESFSLLIYNRWGELIFESTNIEAQWDGIYGSYKAPDGVYTYVVHYKPFSTDTKTMTGHVTLIR
ncbi:MAG: gliding motility-associated C-terminal domain-containing protein [Flavobacteriales bacterium]